MKNIILLFLCLVLTSCTDINIARVYDKDGNIYVVSSEGFTKQLTFTGRDETPIYSIKNKSIYFIRGTGQYEPEDTDANLQGIEHKLLMKLNPQNGHEMVLSDGSSHSANPLYGIRELKLSKSEEYLYFLTPEWSASDVLVKFNLSDNSHLKFKAANNYTIIQKGDFQNKVLIETSKIIPRSGLVVFYQIVDENGKVLKTINEEKQFEDFISQQQIKWKQI